MALHMESHGQPVVLNRRPCGATSRPHDSAFIHGKGRGLLFVGIKDMNEGTEYEGISPEFG